VVEEAVAMVSVEVPENAQTILKRARVGKTPTRKIFAAMAWWFSELPEPLRRQLVRAAQETKDFHASNK
jgi:hypothetical protein